MKNEEQRNSENFDIVELDERLDMAILSMGVEGLMFCNDNGCTNNVSGCGACNVQCV